MPADPHARAALVVHGGAGSWDHDVDGGEVRRQAALDGVRRAAEAGWALLAGGASALDAVEEAVRVLEADPEFNAGYGAVLNALGTVETDAAVAYAEAAGQAPQLGAVGAVPWMRHPVTLARRLLDDGRHALLVGGGAVLFGKEHGLGPDAPELMVAPRQRARRDAGDTVGACAVDARGRLAAATSTGGTLGKRPGRVGDSPLFGAGLYAEHGLGAASATGHGESILRALGCRHAVDALRAGHGVARAAQLTVEAIRAGTGGLAGVILVDAAGNVAHATATRAMPWAALAAGAFSCGFEA